MIDHFTAINVLSRMHADCGFAILGDFNRVDGDPVLRVHGLKQVVDKPTGGDAALDLILPISKIHTAHSSVNHIL